MAQVSKYPLNKIVSQRIMDIFIKTLINIRVSKEAEDLISDFLTPTERIVLSKRLSIALLLEKGYDYRSIIDILKVSSSTIAGVNIARLNKSSGYRKFIDKILSDEQIAEFISNGLVNLSSVPAGVSYGTSVWKELHRIAKEKHNDKEKPF